MFAHCLISLQAEIGLVLRELDLVRLPMDLQAPQELLFVSVVPHFGEQVVEMSCEASRHVVARQWVVLSFSLGAAFVVVVANVPELCWGDSGTMMFPGWWPLFVRRVVALFRHW